MDVVAKAKPDGYTLGLATISQLVFNEYLFAHLPYDPRAVVPIIKLTAGSVVLAAHPSLPANSLRELIMLAKRQPNTIHYAVPQLGSPPHIFALLLTTSHCYYICTLALNCCVEA